ncbi:hypothetical protein ACFL09_02360 [Planctomycetota bacterium]
MAKLDEIKAEIDALPREDYAERRRWFMEKDWEEWDAELEADSKAGRLDFLIEEARHETHKRRL